MDIAIVLGLLVAAVVLFSMEKLSVDLITLLLLLGLLFTGILTPAEAFAGFSNDIIIILASIFVISGALQETGVLDAIGTRLLKFAGASERRMLAAVTVVPAAISGFMNNTTVTAMFLPPVMGIARQMRVSPSRLLMPLAFASILGGTCTLIGTSTNVAVSGYIKQAGLAPIGLFELTPIGLIIVAVGLLYLMLVARKFLPEGSGESITADYHLRQYLSEIVVLPDSPLIGQNTFDSDLNILDFRVLRLMRGPHTYAPESQAIIEEGDTLLVEGQVENLMKVKKIEGIDIKGESGPGAIESGELRIVEALITPQSDLPGQTLRRADFRRRYGLSVLAIYRQERSLRDTLGNVPLRVGDLLLIQGQADRIDALRNEPSFAILGELSRGLYERKYGIVAIGAFALAVLVGGMGWLPLSVAFLAAAVAILLFGCIGLEKAYSIIDWRLLILIGGMTAFGAAMEKTGAAELLASGITGALAGLGILPIMAGFFVLTIGLTQPMSNAAAALVVLPVAMRTAAQLGAEPRTFAIGVMLAASISFITPFEPSCILVYGPGKYKFRDFVKVGGLLTVILAIVVLLLIPVFWPLRAS